MTDTITPAAVEARLVALSDTLDAKAHEYSDLAVTAARAEVNYRVEFGKAYLKAKARKSTDGKATQEATVDCAELLMERKTAEAIANACRESMFTIRAQMDSLRTLSANLRELVRS